MNIDLRSVKRVLELCYNNNPYQLSLVQRIELDTSSGIGRVSPNWKQFDNNHKFSAIVLAHKLFTSELSWIKKWGRTAFLDPDVVRFVIAYSKDWVQLFFHKNFRVYYKGLTGMEFIASWDSETASMACTTNSAVYQYLSYPLKADDNVIENAFYGYYMNFTIDAGKVVVGQEFKKNPDILCLIPADILENREIEFAMRAVQANGMALECVNELFVTVDPTVYQQICAFALDEDVRSFQFFQSKQDWNRAVVFEKSLEQNRDILQEAWFRDMCGEKEFSIYARRQFEVNEERDQQNDAMSGW